MKDMIIRPSKQTLKIETFSLGHFLQTDLRNRKNTVLSEFSLTPPICKNSVLFYFDFKSRTSKSFQTGVFFDCCIAHFDHVTTGT